MPDNTHRFSNRVKDYIKFRPGYPQAVVNFLQEEFGLKKGDTVADIGAGTGISSELFLKNGWNVIGVEPNKEMREAAIGLLQQYKNFSAVDGTAEFTTLPDAAADAVIAGQAFHWFDPPAAKKEFERIVRRGGFAALIWNERNSVSLFEKEYAEFVQRYGNDFVPFEKRIDPEQIAAFFAPAKMKSSNFPNFQSFDLKGLMGRLLSSSYMPMQGEKNYDAMIAELSELFNRHQVEGKITITYETKIFAAFF